MSKKIPRAIAIVIGTAIAGRPVHKDDVLLVPEDVPEDTARSLMRMARPRAVEATERQTAARLAKYQKLQAERQAIAQAKREEEEAAAQAERDAAEIQRQQIIDEATAAAADITAAAEAEAMRIIDEARAEAEKAKAPAKSGK